MKINIKNWHPDCLPTLNRTQQQGDFQMPMVERTTVRWADREYDELKGYADGKSITLSAAIREVILKHIPAQTRPRHFPWFS